MKLLCPLIFLVFFSCSENTTEVKKTTSSNEVKIEEKLEEVDSTQLIIEQIANSYITNRTVKEKLTEFGKKNPESRIVMYTNYGKLKFRLYKNTPLHRANFVLLAKKKFYDHTLFYRVINNFMIQGGNSDDELLNAKLAGIGGYRIPNEIKTNNIHKKGALAMAVSPEEQSFGKKSSAINFYVIEGRKMSTAYFNQQKKKGKKYSEKAINTYKTIGGAPHLDGNYTVFGELTSGMSVLNKISNVKTDKYDWPKKEVMIDSIRAY